MSEPQLFAQLKQFIGFTADDIDNLRSLAPVFKEHGAAITDSFYERLAENPETGPLIAGRVDKLKQTHMRWMEGVVGRGRDQLPAQRGRRPDHDHLSR